MSIRNYIIPLALLISLMISVSFKKENEVKNYSANYFNRLFDFQKKQEALLATIEKSDLEQPEEISKIRSLINLTRNDLKALDFWLRYLEPISYKKINGPLPIEWETEVFEKFEKPYKREGAGLTLATLYLEEKDKRKDSLLNLIKTSIKGTEAYFLDSISGQLNEHHHFFLCNRLFLLNLAAIYSTGFECPEPERIVPELGIMLGEIYKIYLSFNEDFSATKLEENYMERFKAMISFVNNQPASHDKFDHFSFIKDHVNPLFGINQGFIRQYHVVTKSNMDYSLNNKTASIFSKSLYTGQNTKGIFHSVHQADALKEIENTGKLLFYDPLLSGNNLRSCASCHKPSNCFTDTSTKTSLQFDGSNFLPRNSPSLVNVQYNHLIMLDGKHTSLQSQTREVVTNPIEMACSEKEILKKIMSCADYKKAFKSLIKYTPLEKEITLEHVFSAITFYYSRFGQHSAPFDEAMNNRGILDNSSKQGFNIFMGKAQCGTCHFAPIFNGVKPPYVSSEFEVLGVPEDSGYKTISPDKGRFGVNPATETIHAFRTGTIRNSERTKPYMHNGIFNTLEEVIEFYDTGGGAGHGLSVNNQTLASDSLHLSAQDKKDLLAFMRSLNESVPQDLPPQNLPASKIKELNKRKVGGEY